uniref:Uncharacterized protein n=1 Tax=Globodera rostochiensis TaxID=31243 RepID=A0A914I1H8_GLORO
MAGTKCLLLRWYSRSLVPTHQLPPTSSQRTLTVKDQLMMFFQQQHKVHMQLEQKFDWRAQYNGPPSRTTILMND